MPEYDHQNRALIDFEMIKDLFPSALERSRALNAARKNENCPMGCPSTNIGELVVKIVENGKKWSEQLKLVNSFKSET